MATFLNPRKLNVVNPFENAEGNVSLAFKGLELHAVNPSDFPSKRNGLPMTRFTAINPVNGDTIGILVQLGLRERLLDAVDRAANGELVVFKSIQGDRIKREYQTGMTTIVAKNLDIEFKSLDKSRTTVRPMHVPAAVLRAQSALVATPSASNLPQ